MERFRFQKIKIGWQVVGVMGNTNNLITLIIGLHRLVVGTILH